MKKLLLAGVTAAALSFAGSADAALTLTGGTAGTIPGAAASNAAQFALGNENNKPCFALLVSCVGRKLILGPRIEEEVEAVIESLGPDTTIAGFYSYGEISPFNQGGDCRLHNQTMTITTFYELP